MEGAEFTIKRHAMRALTPNSGYCVRKSEETIRNLRKENFNLKLKIYLLENKRSPLVNTDMTMDHNEHLDLIMDIESLKLELQDKNELLKEALEVIKILEDQKINYERKCQEMMIDQPIQTFRLIKLKPKIGSRKKSQVKCSPIISGDSLNDFNFQMVTLRAENNELKLCINELEKQNEMKKTQIIQLEETIKMNGRTLKNSQMKIGKLLEILRQQCSNDSKNLENDNETMKKTVEGLLYKCEKLERDKKDLERIMNEQNSLMKALNRSIEAKNEQMVAFKNQFELYQASSSCTSDDVLFYPEDLKFTGNDNVPETSDESYPFFNPLYGKEYESIYR